MAINHSLTPSALRVLHVIPSVAPRYGGPSQAVLEMCCALQTGGIEVLIATTNADGESRLPVELERTSAYHGMPVIFFPRQWSEAFKYSGPLAQWLDKNVSGFDVVHVHAVFSHPSLAAARACQRHGVPYLVRPLGSLDPWSLTQRRMEKNVLWHLGVKKMLRSAAALHYTTATERHLAEAALGINSGVVIPLGISDEILASSIDGKAPMQVTNKPYILTLCRLHPKKGLDLLIHTFLGATSIPELENWQLVIAGDGEPKYVTGLKHLVQQKRGEDRVVFTGWLRGEEKFSALKGASLFVLASRQENFAISVAEAMACGVPVIVSEHVNLADEIYSARAGWVVSLEQKAFQRILTQALRDEQERSARGGAGRKLVSSRYTWPAVTTELMQLYRSITSQSGRKRLSAQIADSGSPA